MATAVIIMLVVGAVAAFGILKYRRNTALAETKARNDILWSLLPSHEPKSAADLARHTLYGPPTLSPVLKSLLNDGLITVAISRWGHPTSPESYTLTRKGRQSLGYK